MFNIIYTQWPGGHCNKGDEMVCCEPSTGYPSFDFYVNRLIAYNQNGTSRSICTDSPFIEANVRPCLLSFTLTTFTYYYLIKKVYLLFLIHIFKLNLT